MFGLIMDTFGSPVNNIFKIRILRTPITLKYHYQTIFKNKFVIRQYMSPVSTHEITKSSGGSNNYHNFKVMMSIGDILRDLPKTVI